MSMSADSVFTPDPRPGSSIEALKETTRSMEVLPQGFTHELFRKIKRRGKADSDDEGISNSPVSPTSTSGDIGGLKKSSKSGSKDSNLSMASSDNDPDEEIFGPKWSHGVVAPTKKSKAKGKSEMDLDLITSSTSLDSSMFKDKIAVGRKNRRPISRLRQQQPSPSAKRSPTPLTQVEETNENEDEIQVTIEAPPAQITPEPVEKTPLLMDEVEPENKSVIRPPRTPSPVIRPQSPTVVVLPKVEELPKQTIVVEKPKEIETKKKVEETKSNSLPRSLSGSRPGSRQDSIKKSQSSLSSEDEKSNTSLDKIKDVDEVKEEPKREELVTPVERANSRKESPNPLERISPKPIEKTDSTKRNSTPIGVKRASLKKDEQKQPEVLTIERVDSKKEEKIKPPVSPKIKAKHDLPVSPMKEEQHETKAKTPEPKNDLASEPAKPKEETKEAKDATFPVVLRRTGKLNEIHEKGTLRKPSLETAAKRQTIAGDAPFSVFADLKEIPSSNQSKDDMAPAGKVENSEFAQMFNKLRKQASVKKSIDEVEKRRGPGASVSTVRTNSIKITETEEKPEIAVASPPSEKKTEVVIDSPPTEKKVEVTVAKTPTKESKTEVTVASPPKERKTDVSIGSPPKDVPKKPETVPPIEPQKKTEIVLAKPEMPAEKPIIRKLTDKRPPIEKKPEVLSPKPIFANVSLKSPTKPEEKKPLPPIASLKSPSTNEEQKTVPAKPQVKPEEKNTIVITKETEKEPAPLKSPTVEKPTSPPVKNTETEPTSPSALTGPGGTEPSWFALARRKTSSWGDKDDNKEQKDNNNMAVKKEQEETMKTEKPEPTTLIIEKKPEPAKQETKEEGSGKPLLRTGSKCGPSADRSSKVFDLIKNFQNNQVT